MLRLAQKSITCRGRRARLGSQDLRPSRRLNGNGGHGRAARRTIGRLARPLLGVPPGFETSIHLVLESPSFGQNLMPISVMVPFCMLA